MQPDDQDQSQNQKFSYTEFIDKLSIILEETKPKPEHTQIQMHVSNQIVYKQRKICTKTAYDQLQTAFPWIRRTLFNQNQTISNQHNQIKLKASKQEKLVQKLQLLTKQVTIKQKIFPFVEDIQQILTQYKQSSYLQYQRSEIQQYSQGQQQLQLKQSVKSTRPKAEQLNRNINIFYNYIPIPQSKKQIQKINQCFDQNTTRQKLLTPNYHKQFIENMYKSYKQREGLKSRQEFANFLIANTLHAIKLDNIKKSI